MAKEKSNGKAKSVSTVPYELQPTGDSPPAGIQGLSKPPPGYEKFKEFVNGLDTVGKSFSTPDIVSGLKMLADPGDNVNELPMRSNFPDKRTMLAIADHLAKCREFEYAEEERNTLFIVAGYCGIKGDRARMLVDAIIGERSLPGHSGGIRNWVKEKAGLG